MKIVIAVVRPYVAESLLQNLRLAPLEALQIAEVKGFGRQKSYLDQYSATEYSLAFLPKIEITMFVDDMRVEEVLGGSPRSLAVTASEYVERISRSIGPETRRRPSTGPKTKGRSEESGGPSPPSGGAGAREYSM